MCENCANRDIRTTTTIIDPETGAVLHKKYNDVSPNLNQRINELEQRLSYLEFSIKRMGLIKA